MDEFSRTATGQVNQYLFQRIPIVWVEGVDDVPQVQQMLIGIKCKVKSAGGRANCEVLIDSLKADDSPYVVLVDGDYEILISTRSRHRRGLTLLRHSMENYFCEVEIIEHVCRLLGGEAHKEVSLRRLFGRVVPRFERGMTGLVESDVAAWVKNCRRSFFPKNADAILAKEQPIVENSMVKRFLDRVPAELKPSDLSEARKLIGEFAEGREKLHIVRGHIVFGFVRKLIRCHLKNCGRRRTLDDQSLRAILAVATWDRPAIDDHRSIRRRIRRATRQAASLLAA